MKIEDIEVGQVYQYPNLEMYKYTILWKDQDFVLVRRNEGIPCIFEKLACKGFIKAVPKKKVWVQVWLSKHAFSIGFNSQEEAIRYKEYYLRGGFKLLKEEVLEYEL